MKHDVNFFIDFFGKIPEEKWCSYNQENSRGQHCAFGHVAHSGIGGLYGGLLRLSNQVEVLNVTFIPEKAHPMMNGKQSMIADVNNGAYEEYQQPTEKQRILALLNDYKAYLEAENLVKEAQEIVNTENLITETV